MDGANVALLSHTCRVCGRRHLPCPSCGRPTARYNGRVEDAHTLLPHVCPHPAVLLPDLLRLAVATWAVTESRLAACGGCDGPITLTWDGRRFESDDGRPHTCPQDAPQAPRVAARLATRVEPERATQPRPEPPERPSAGRPIYRGGVDV